MKTTNSQTFTDSTQFSQTFKALKRSSHFPQTFKDLQRLCEPCLTFLGQYVSSPPPSVGWKYLSPIPRDAHAALPAGSLWLWVPPGGPSPAPVVLVSAGHEWRRCWCTVTSFLSSSPTLWMKGVIPLTLWTNNCATSVLQHLSFCPHQLWIKDVIPFNTVETGHLYTSKVDCCSTMTSFLLSSPTLRITDVIRLMLWSWAISRQVTVHCSCAATSFWLSSPILRIKDVIYSTLWRRVTCRQLTVYCWCTATSFLFVLTNSVNERCHSFLQLYEWKMSFL